MAVDGKVAICMVLTFAAAEVVFEAAPGGGILWRFISWARDLEKLEEAAGYIEAGFVLPPTMRRFGKIIKTSVKVSGLVSVPRK